MSTQISPYRTIKQMVAENPAITEGGLRYDIFHEDENGLAASGAIVRKGRRILIHVPKYFAWIESGAARKERAK